MKYNVLQYLEERQNESPDKAAFADELRSFTFKELKSAAFIVADHIYNEKKSNRPIAVVMPKSTLSLVSFFGVLYSGNFYSPIDAKYPEERLKIVLNDLSPEVVIIDNHTYDLLQKLDIPGVQIINIEKIFESKRESEFDYTEVINKKIDTDPIYCIYTSGSTGIPKGVVIPHRAVVDYLEYAVPTFKMGKETIVGNQAQFHFDLSVLDVFAPLKSGCTTVVIPDNFFTFTAKLIPFIEKFKINFLCWAPAVLNYLSSVDILKDAGKPDFNHIIFCGEALPTKSLNYWRKNLSDTVFVNLYGPTETTLSSMNYFICRDFTEDESLPIGRADRNTDVFLLNIENGVGEICIKGSSLALGYWNDFKKTEEKFIQNPTNSNYPERIYLTGDLGKVNEIGEMMYVGRKDNQIKHMGYRIELEEIERAIERIPGIAASYVFYDLTKKEIICSFGAKEQELTELMVKKSLKVFLPNYMIPSNFIKFNDLPLNSRGKIDRTKIKETYYGKN
jgi:amino acid adenylation domain-containing protein